MAKPAAHVVWFKRDLRLSDHAPLRRADALCREESGRQGGRVYLLPLYVVEPGLLACADFSDRHWAFIRQSLEHLRAGLRAAGSELFVREGEAVEVFKSLLRAFDVRGVHAHEETGNGFTYQRDKDVARLLRGCGVPFIESWQNGVIRGLKSRTGWAQKWEARMGEAVLEAPETLCGPPKAQAGEIPTRPACRGMGVWTGQEQQGGEVQARAVLDSFLSDRGVSYFKHISSPLLAETAGSRLSPYLAYGNISLREVVQTIRRRKQSLGGGRGSGGGGRGSEGGGRGSGGGGDGAEDWMWRRSITTLDARLHWHCHFMQKFESEPGVEDANFMRSMDGLREGDFDRGKFEAWCEGRTGYPMVDACMRMLRETGWVNFRMRAMLVSFAAYDLWLHWKEPAVHLAGLFTDYEPGIHYCQMQMQSGTTGINTIRTYSPVKQAQDHDPEGVFVKKWVPELRDLPGVYVFEPWKAPAEVQLKAGCVMGRDYPKPIVDHALAVKEAREKIYALRRQLHVRAEADGVQEKHGSRKSGMKQVGERRPKVGKKAKGGKGKMGGEGGLFEEVVK